MKLPIRCLIAIDAAFWVAGIAITLYLAGAVAGFVSASSEHYSNFLLATLAMAGLSAMRAPLSRAIEKGTFSGTKVRLAAAVVGTIGVTVAAGYVRLHAVELEMRQPFFSQTQFVMGALLTVSVLILTWLHWGGLLTAFIAIAIAYFFLGHHISHPLLGHPEYSPNFVMNYLGLGTTDGMFWFARDAADNIWFLVLFAGVLFGVGTLPMIVELGMLAGRRVAGGAAAPALIGSFTVGAIMGTAVSNVVMTGRFTIPMMKKYGYSPSMAGSIEAAASTAGQISPPILGLAAFIIAALLNIPYVDVVMASVIPAALYMTGITFGVIVYARRHNLPRLEGMADMRLILRMMPTFLISFGIVLWLLIAYYSPAVAGIAGCVSALALGLTQGRFRPRWRQLVTAIREALDMAATLSLILIAIGPLAQTFLTTNFSGKIGTFLLLVLPNSEIIVLLAGALLALILGMGLPTPVAYVIVALAVVPYLQEFGVAPLAAHFFVFWFACFSTLTPPVAVSVLAAAKLSGASFWDTARDSMGLALTTFVIPFAFVFHPSLLAFPSFGANLILPLVTLLLLQLTVVVAFFGHFRRRLEKPERMAFWVVALSGYIAIVDRGSISNFAFFALLIAAMALASRRPVGISAPVR